MINFELQIKKFLNITKQLKISANAQCLYFQILDFFDKHFYPEELEIDNMLLHGLTYLSRHQITSSRVELQTLSLIRYENGIGSRSGKYSLIDISNAKLSSIIELSKQNDVKIDNLQAIKKHVEEIAGDENRVWGNYILKTLERAIRENKTGVYNNFYTTSQVFLHAELQIQIPLLYKLIMIMREKPDLQNREAYILACIANYVKDNMPQRSTIRA